VGFSDLGFGLSDLGFRAWFSIFKGPFFGLNRLLEVTIFERVRWQIWVRGFLKAKLRLRFRNLEV